MFGKAFESLCKKKKKKAGAKFGLLRTTLSSVIPKYYTSHDETVYNQLYFKSKIDFSQLSDQVKRCYHVSAKFLQFLEEPTCQLTEACPRISSKGLSGCAKLTKSLRETEKCFVSTLFGFVSKPFHFHESFTQSVHVEKQACPLEFTFPSFSQGRCVNYYST